MRLISLRLRNFRQHAHSDIEFASDGITAIVGSNESGKSSILEAIAWALYGARATRGTMRGLRWHRAPARRVAAATLEFGVGGRHYAIDRTESSAELLDVNQDIVIAQGTDAVNRYVPELLGMRLEEFSASYMAAQKDLARMASMTPTERQAFVRRVLGLDRIDEALKECRARKNDLARERDGLASGLGDREQLAADAAAAMHARDATDERGVEAASAREAAAEEDQARRAELAESQKRADRHVYLQQNERHLRRDIETADREIERVERERQEAARAAEELERRSPRLEHLPGLRQRRDDLVDIRSTIQRLDQQRDTIHDLHESLADTDAQVKTFRQQVDAFNADALHAAAAELEAVRERLEGLAHSRAAQVAQCKTAAEGAAATARKAQRKLEVIRAAGAAGACPTCLRALGETYELVVQTLEADLSEARAAERDWTAEAESHVRLTDEERELSARVLELTEEVNRGRRQAAAVETARGQLRRLEAERERIDQRRSQVAAALAEAPRVPDPAELQRLIAETTAQVHELEVLDRELTPYRAQASRVDALAAERNERVAARADTIEHIGQIMAELRELAFDIDAHNEIAARAREAAERRQAADVEAARVVEAYRAALAQCERAERALADYDARAGRLEELTRDLRTHTAVAERLDAFRVAQASAIRPELEELTTGFVSLLTDGRHDGVTITEDFALILSESGVDTEVVSGGTEDVAALAMRLAISQMIAMRAGHPLSLLVLDEPFGSLDAVRRGNVMALIRRLRGIFEQVLLISHIEETRDSADHVIEIEYDEAAGRARVIQATAPEPVAVLEAVA